MRFPRMVLHKYHRLATRNIKTLVYTPKSKLQLLLGTNGSGKSSVMKELTPLPAVHSQYEAGGYKEIDVEHNGDFYELKSDFSVPGNRYSFKKNGEELNTGGTLSVYRDLVRLEFGITQEYHDMATGVIKFTSMDVKQRREWLTELSTCDYTYSLSYFDRLNKSLRDTNGALKLAKEKLVEETKKLMTQEDIQRIESEIKDLNELIETLTRNLPSVTSGESIATIHSQQTSLKNDIAALTASLNSSMKTLPKLQDQSVLRRLNAHLHVLNENINLSRGSSSRLMRVLDDLHQQRRQLKDQNLTSTHEIEGRINAIDEFIDSQSRMLKTGLHFEHPAQIETIINGFMPALSELLTTMPSNPDKAINKTYADSLRTQLAELRVKLATMLEHEENVRKLIKEYERLQKEPETSCPKCEHSWIVGYNEEKHKAAVTALSQYVSNIETVKTKEAELVLKLEEVTTYFEYITQYRQYVNTWRELEPAWDCIGHNEWIFKNPKLVIQFFYDLVVDLRIMAKIATERSNRNSLTELKKLSSEQTDLSMEKLEAKIAELEKELHDDMRSIQLCEAELNSVQSYIRISDKLTEQMPKINELISAYQASVQKELEESLNHARRTIIVDLRRQANERSYQLNRAGAQLHLVNSIKQDIAQMETDIEVLRIAVKELSPKEGLIAKSMLGFINHFIRNVNQFIRTTWQYPLEILPIVASEDGVSLNYKFKFTAGENGKPIDDISLGSSAMLEIIDLAINVIQMQYRGFHNYPLYLDELGHSMDAVHRVAIFNVITNLFTSADFEQIFVVSHFSESYGSLTDTDINVLCPANVVMPKHLEYNQQLRIN